MAKLLLGPLLRYVDDTSATVWVETDVAATVEVLGCTARTFQVRGHHYALVPVRGLRPGSTTPYQVRLDDEPVWPVGDEPPCRIKTIPTGHGSGLRLWFGSCRFGTTEDVRHAEQLGTDALRVSARLLKRAPDHHRPDALLLLGDQVYADQTAPELQRELRTRRDLDRPPGTEIANFEEYVHLYRYSWSEPEVRWLLSTVPTMMIFDDHDIRDDWNISQRWRARMARTSWWRQRLLGGIVAYWIYQHIGNLSPDQLAQDEVYRAVVEVGEAGDAWEVLREFAARADTEHNGRKGARWSYRRDLGPARLVVLDTRCGRMLETTERSMHSAADFEWIEQSLDGEHDHVLLASSLPWLLPPVIHHVQSWNEVACTERGRTPWLAEKLRQAADLEHWAAFRRSFDRLSNLIAHAARGPATVNVLSGDVHHSYLADAEYPSGTRSRVVQITCSPLHNALHSRLRGPLRLAWSDRFTKIIRKLSERAGVPPVPLTWSKFAGPYLGNMIAELDLESRHATVALRQAGDDGLLTTVCLRELA
ncbi:alkaline phosphatase D family protein [Parasphingorhabdus pacifica]